MEMAVAMVDEREAQMVEDWILGNAKDPGGNRNSAKNRESTL